VLKLDKEKEQAFHRILLLKKLALHLSFFKRVNVLCQVIEGQAAVHRCTCEVNFTGTEHPIIPPTVNDARIYEHVRRVSIDIVGEGNVELAPIFMGSEDFAFYLDKVPGSFLFLGMRNEKIGSIYLPHSPYYTIDEDVFPIGASVYAVFAHSYLSNSTRNLNSYD